MFDNRKRYKESRCKKCKEQCPLYKNGGELLREVPFSIYQSALKLLETRKKITLVELQRELKVGYALANSIIDKLTLDGRIACPKYGIERKILIKR